LISWNDIEEIREALQRLPLSIQTLDSSLFDQTSENPRHNV
jgi:hypothetical protein